MKASNYKTTIFSMALTLFQSGRAKNTVYCGGRNIFLLNFDKTFLLKFTLPNEEAPFESDAGFAASDYEDGDFYEEGGEIIFVSGDGDFRKEKRCRAPGKTTKQVQELFESYWKDLDKKTFSSIVLSESNLALLKSDLSHVEISAENKEVILTQRDIYSGTKTTLKRESGPLGVSHDNIKKDFSPIGWRTPDIHAMFFICPSIHFYFPPNMEENTFCLIEGTDKSRGIRVDGVLSGCLYDELETVRTSKIKEGSDGREKQKNRRRKQGIDKKTDGGTEEKRKDNNSARGARRRRRRNAPAEEDGVIFE